ncbi:MAG: hypothetical protein GEV12_12245 [Micromonosporaceae bacterium]|nr:hypothetical protein [Micromonosporaceae bacterium]
MPESYVQRAELLADLGRYEEAAAELAEAPPTDVPALILLARVRLAGGSPREALAAADAAVAAWPTDLPAMIARGMTLAELGRVDEAAGQAEQILRRGRGDGYACTSAAAILAEVRVGQVALDAAWEGVRLVPDQPRSHLVLGVVASRLGLDEIAGRAYLEALGLDPQLAVAEPAPAALGMARAEQHRYAAALSHLRRAEAVGSGAGSGSGGGGGSGSGSGGAGAAADRWTESPVPGEVHRIVRYGAGYAVVAPLLVAAAVLSGSAAPAVSALLAGAGLAGGLVAWQRLPEEHRADLPELVRAERALAVAVWAVLAAPVLLLLFALVDSPWLLVAALAAGIVAGLASRRRPAS